MSIKRRRTRHETDGKFKAYLTEQHMEVGRVSSRVCTLCAVLDTHNVDLKITCRQTSYSSYHICTNSPRCDKVFAIIFIMIITGIFVTSIVLAMVKANLMVLYRLPLNVSADNIGNGSFSEMLVVNNENIGTEQNSLEQTTTEAVNVERFLENLSDVYDDSQVHESTTEMSNDDRNGRRKSNDYMDDSQDPTTLEPTEPLPPLIPEVTSTSVSSTIFQPTTTQRQPTTTEAQSSTEPPPTTIQSSTTTVAPSVPFPNPCLITDSDQCEITCSNTNSTVLTNALIQLIDGIDLQDYQECPFAEIKLQLTNISFSDSGLNISWLGNIGTNIVELRIKNPKSFSQISGYAFDSEQFSSLEVLSIDGGDSARLDLESSESFIGATSLKFIKISDFERINFEPNVFQYLSLTLTHLEISRISKPSNYSWNNSFVNLLRHSDLQNLESLIIQRINFFNISLSKQIFDTSKESIKSINLANTNVLDLTSDTFAGFKHLKELHLENNIIKDILSGTFDDLENLEMLFLQNNKLTTIPDKLFDTQLNSEQLAIVNLSRNPWFCDFQIYYLKQFLLATTAEVAINNCDGPLSVADIPIQDLWCHADACMISCEFTARKELLAELESLDMSTCTEVDLHLKYHTFSNETLPDQWLSQLDFSIHKLTIDHSNIKSIKNGTFNSPIFENLKEMTIDHNNETDLVIDKDGMFGLKTIEILKIERSAGLTLTSEYNILEPIKDSLKEISVSYLIEPFNPRLMFENTELKNLKNLQLSGNNFEYIEFTSTTFEGVHENLEEIYVLDSAVTNITADAFSGFKSLKTINLAGNDIESLDGQFFGSDPDKKLVSINLSNLNLMNLDVDTFNGCKKLQELFLSQNLIGALNAGIFDDLENLEFLHLEDNLLTKIPKNLFKTQLEAENLKFVNFTNNPWICDPEIINLKQFLIETRAEILINGCTNLNLFGQDIKDLWCRQDACSLICEKTNDNTLPINLQIYEMTHCGSTSLQLISHSFNNNTFNSNSLLNLKFKVHSLIFDKTVIELIQNWAFDLEVFKDLRELKIANSPVSCYINTTGLSELKSIEVFTIDNIKELRTFISYSIFSPIQNTIREITVKGTSEKINVNHLFDKPNFTNLKVLRLTNNSFKDKISTSTFKGANKTLEEIYLSNTINITFDANAFSMFENLKIVDFEGCDLKSLDGAFFGLAADKKLTLINFSNTKLESLGNDTFFGCNQLKTLDLSNNFIERIDPGTFDDLTNLESLYLNNNSLTAISKNVFKVQLEAEKLSLVDLSNNPWNCDAFIIYLKHFLEFSKAEIRIDGCTKPEKLVGRSIKDLWCKVNSCTIVCEETDHHLELVLDYPVKLNCDTIDLKLTSHKPNNFIIESRFLSNLNFSIQKLSMDMPFIEEIYDDAFNSLVFENLESITMTRNFDSCWINSNAFAGLNAIKFIEIDQFPQIDWISAANILSPVRSTLKEVRITNIDTKFKLQEIFEQTRFEKLKILQLNGNKFQSLNEFNFVGTHETLEELYLRNSNISDLKANTFSGFKNLKLIDLGDNILTTVESSHFGDLLNDENLKIFVSGNPWNCTCEIEFLLGFIADDVNVTCKNPEEFAGKNIYELDEACHLPTTTTDEPTTTTSTTLAPTTSSTTKTPTTTTRSTTKQITSTTTEEPTTTTTTEEPTTTTTTTKEPTTTTTTTKEPTTTTTEEQTTTVTTTTSPTTSFPNTTTTSPTTSGPNTTKDPETPDATQPTGDISGSTTSPKGLYTPSYITCFDPDNVENTSQAPFQYDFESRNIPLNMQIPLDRPTYEFKSIKTKEGTQNEVSVEIKDFPMNAILLYYPSTDDPFAHDRDLDERFSIRCLTVSRTVIFVKNLAPNVIYNFCLIINVSVYQVPYISPFQCRSYQIAVGKPWLYEEQKPVILTSLSLLIIMALIVGIILTYCLIRQIPTLIKGSKRVVLVNNRAKEVMILPRSSTQSSSQSVSSSCRKDSVNPIHNEPPTYLTPLPRQSFDHRPPFHRSSSDTSLKSYVSVSRLPPRFSQVYHRDEFEPACYKHHNSFPHCPPTAPFPPVSDIPPPLPRRSIVSNSSSTQHSSASTVELGRTMSRAHNSTYRRHPRPIEIEQENHYNVII